jgi:hypothetical protein
MFLLVACGGTRTVEDTRGTLVIVLDPVRPTALDSASLPFEISVRRRGGDLLGNYSLSHVNDPLVLLVRPGRYAITVSAGCRAPGATFANTGPGEHLATIQGVRKASTVTVFTSPATDRASSGLDVTSASAWSVVSATYSAS